MRFRTLCSAAVLAALCIPGQASAGKKPQVRHRTGLILHDNVPLRSRPSSGGRVLAHLVEQTQVKVLATKHRWDRVLIWDSVVGWVPMREVTFRKPWPSVSTYKAPEVHYAVHARDAEAVRAEAKLLAPARVANGGPPATMGAGAAVTVTAWREDVAGKIWYRVGTTWVPGDVVRFASIAESGPAGARQPLWKAVAGKGMWITLGTITGSAPEAIVDAARKVGVSHLYLEAAISPLGFHGRGSVGPLLDAARKAHIAVIAWVYPYLYDVGADVELTRQVAAFRTKIGNRFDGIAADLERNVQVWNVRAYSQLVRAYVGPKYVLVGVTYPPQSSPNYPFAEVARQYNVIAPMDYWHETKTAYGLNYGGMRYGREYGRRYAADSVNLIRSAGVATAVAPIGQAFDDFGRLEMGPNAPSSEETVGFMQGCKQSGAIGASFFQWMTVTQGEWHAIRTFRF